MTTANSAILRITKELTWAEEVLAAMAGMRAGELGFHDRVFDNDMNVAVAATRQACAFPGCWPRLRARLLKRACPYSCSERRCTLATHTWCSMGFGGFALHTRHVYVHA